MRKMGDTGIVFGRVKGSEEDQRREVGDNHQVYSKPICCLINRLLMLRVPCARHPARLAPKPRPSHWPIQAGRSHGMQIEGYGWVLSMDGSKRESKNGPPFFVLMWIPKQTHPLFCWKPHRTAWLQEQMVQRTSTGRHLCKCLIQHISMSHSQITITGDYF